MRTFKQLSNHQASDIEREVTLMLHAGRDWMRNRKMDTTDLTFDVNDPYRGEAFGILRGLQVLGYGEFGSDNVPNSIHARWNLKWWYRQLEERCLDDENWGDRGLTNNECDHCLERYGKDAVRLRSKTAAGLDIIVSPTTGQLYTP